VPNSNKVSNIKKELRKREAGFGEGSHKADMFNSPVVKLDKKLTSKEFV